MSTNWELDLQMRYSQEGERGMTRFAGATIIVTVLIASFAFAQDSTPKVQVFGGYSLLNQISGGPTDISLDLALHPVSGGFGVATNFNGWSAEAQYNANRWVGIVADFGGRNGSPITAPGGVSGLPNGKAYSFLAGPVISYRTKSRLTPFVHVLAGWERSSLNASTITGVSPPVSSAAETYTDFAIALGGGLDYSIFRHFALRVGQLDYYHTSQNLSKFYGTAFGGTSFEGLATRQVYLRISAGAVLRF
jgi:opacity protein-like surface antigen